MKYFIEKHPDKNGFYGKYGGRFLPSKIMEEFDNTLHSGPDRKVESIRQYVIGHPEYCNLIYEDNCGGASINEAIAFVSDRYK